MEVTSTTTDGVVVIAVQGEVDLYASPRLRDEIVRWTRKRTPSLIIDLGGITYMDSSGIATLVEGLQLTRRYGGRFGIARPSPSISEVLRFAHLEKILRTFSSVEEALERP